MDKNTYRQSAEYLNKIKQIYEGKAVPVIPYYHILVCPQTSYVEAMRNFGTATIDNFTDIINSPKSGVNYIAVIDYHERTGDEPKVPDDECTINNTTKLEDSCKARTKQYRDIHYRNEYRSESLEKFRDENINPESINRGIIKYLKKLKDNKMDFKNLNEDLLKSMSNDLMSFIDKEEKYRREKKKIGDLEKDDQLI